MISILFTTSDKWMAQLIRWATGEDCSHCAILWEETVIHSNWKGIHAEHLSEFLKENRIVHSVEMPEDTDKLVKLLEARKNNPYDIGALLFCGVVLFSRKALGIHSWPKMNLWQSSGMYLCTEFVTEYINGEADSLITPYKLYERIK